MIFIETTQTEPAFSMPLPSLKLKLDITLFIFGKFLSESIGEEKVQNTPISLKVKSGIANHDVIVTC